MAASSKTILVTGGAGFIGSHLCERLAQDGYRVISLDNYFTGSRDNHVPGVEYREGHTKDIAALVPETPDLIYHLGEYSRVEQSVFEPDIVRDLNSVGTRGVVEFWKDRKCKLVYAGSSTIFAGADWKAKETIPYVVTKTENTELVRRVGDTARLPYAITSFYNVYGPGERAGIYGTVIESFRRMYASGTPLTVTSPGTQTRNFTHVDDIVDGLLLVAEQGQGSDFNLGSERSYSILEVAQLFGGDVIMLPERAESRAFSSLDASKSRALGWEPKRSLEAYVREFVFAHAPGTAREKRILVFSTTFYPTAGPAEEALLALMRKMPDVTFDIVTTVFSRAARAVESPVENAKLYRVGFGNRFDKFLFPIFGFAKARSLHRQHRYLFAWAIMASYAALAAVLLKRVSGLPLLITLADQRVERLSPLARALLRSVLRKTDQVYGTNTVQETQVADVARRPLTRSSIGEGDAFANQIRFSYAQILTQTGRD